MPSRSTSIKITGNVTEALAAMDKLGLKVEETAAKTESKLGGASHRVGGVFSGLGQKLGQFGIPFSESLDKIGEKFSDVETKGKGFASNFAQVGQAAALGLAGAAVSIGGVGVEAALAAQKVEAQLKTAVENTGSSFEEFEPKMRAADATLRKFGFTNNETNQALTTLTQALGSPEKALSAYKVAADLARAKNLDLNTSALMVAKGMEGQTRPLKQLGIDLPVYAGGAQQVHLAQLALSKAQSNVNAILQKSPDAINPASKAHQSYEKALAAVQVAQTKLHAVQSSGPTILAALEKRVNGAGEAYGKTFAGQVAQAKAQLDNVAERIGNRLIPALAKAMTATENVVTWFSKHKAIAEALGAVVGGVLVVAIGAYAVTMAQAAIATVAATWPVLAIIAAVAALGVGIYELVKHWHSVWGEIKTVMGDAWNFIKSAFDFIMNLAIAPLKAALKALETLWSTEWAIIRTVLTAAWNDVIKPVMNFIINAGIWLVRNEIRGLQVIWSSVWGMIKSVVSTTWDGLKSIFGFLVNLGIHLVRDEINGLKTIWDKIWNGIKDTISTVWNTGIKPVFDAIKRGVDDVMGAVSKVTGLAGKVGGGVEHLLGFGGSNKGGKGRYSGGWTTGAPGQISPDWVHGGEFVLSTDMLAGRQRVDPAVVSAITNNNAPTPAGAFGGDVVNNYTVNAQTNATATDIMREFTWLARANSAIG